MSSNEAYQKTAVVFLDILGTRQRRTFAEKFAVHRLFHDEVQRNKSRQEQSPHVAYQRDLRSFSDCVYIFYTYKDDVGEERRNDLRLLYTCLNNTALSILRIMDAGFLVRGGASFGDCFIDDLSFFGPSAECAYYLESKEAIYPRVLIEDEAGAKLFQWERDQEMAEPMAAMFNAIPRLILQDHDGRYFLNVFYQLELTNVMNIGGVDMTLDSVRSRVLEKIDKSASNETEPRILEKLKWMKTYTLSAELGLKADFARGSRSIVLGP